MQRGVRRHKGQGRERKKGEKKREEEMEEWRDKVIPKQLLKCLKDLNEDKLYKDLFKI